MESQVVVDRKSFEDNIDCLTSTQNYSIIKGRNWDYATFMPISRALKIFVFFTFEFHQLCNKLIYYDSFISFMIE